MGSFVALTNYGLRYTQELIKTDPLNRLEADAEARLLVDLYTGCIAPDRDDTLQRDLMRRCYICCRGTIRVG